MWVERRGKVERARGFYGIWGTTGVGLFGDGAKGVLKN